jgi:murein L,D-transpeptidase YcbB/YkuD
MVNIKSGWNDKRRLLKYLDDLYQTIQVNLERYRWMGQISDPERIEINIPACMLRYYQHNQCLFEANVIVGKRTSPTVVFKASLDRVIQNPYWYVPASITRNEILPLLSKRRYYLRQHNMEWYHGGIRQKPGAQNALGLLKFEFDNPYSIFLHDTPSKGLFSKKNRFFSHGCIRLENPRVLANNILRGQRMDTIKAEEKKTIVWILPKAIPVYVVYFTAWIDNNGLLQQAPDWYKKDQLVNSWLEQKWRTLGLSVD